MALLVRYFAGARAAAGVGRGGVEVPDGATVDDLAGLLAERHGPRWRGCSPRARSSSTRCPAAATARCGGARRVDVLPPFAGG